MFYRTQILFYRIAYRIGDFTEASFVLLCSYLSHWRTPKTKKVIIKRETKWTERSRTIGELSETTEVFCRIRQCVCIYFSPLPHLCTQKICKPKISSLQFAKQTGRKSYYLQKTSSKLIIKNAKTIDSSWMGIRLFQKF